MFIKRKHGSTEHAKRAKWSHIHTWKHLQMQLE